MEKIFSRSDTLVGTRRNRFLSKTPAGKPTHVFHSVYQGRDVRLTIGSPDAWSIPAPARESPQVAAPDRRSPRPKRLERPEARRLGCCRASSRTDESLTSPNHALSQACDVARIDGLTLHGLRRSFSSLAEWLEIPAGVVAQIMGHKPSATAEKHYRVRPLDLLRVHHERIEAWVLEQAGIAFDRTVELGKLRVVPV